MCERLNLSLKEVKRALKECRGAFQVRGGGGGVKQAAIRSTENRIAGGTRLSQCACMDRP